MFDQRDERDPDQVGADPVDVRLGSGAVGPAEPAGEPVTTGVFGDTSTGALVDTLTQLAALERAVRAQQLQVIAELDGRQAWTDDGQTGMAAWLTLLLTIPLPAARTMLRTAKAVASLPQIATVFAEGGLSWDQLVPLCRFATADDDGDWAVEAPGYTPRELECLAQLAAGRTSQQTRTAQEARCLTVRRDRQIDGLSVATLKLPDDEMGSVLAAVDRLANQAFHTDPTSADGPAEATSDAPAPAGEPSDAPSNQGTSSPGVASRPTGEAKVGGRAASTDESSDAPVPVRAPRTTVSQRRADALATLATALHDDGDDHAADTLVIHAPLDALLAHPDLLATTHRPTTVDAITALAQLQDATPISTETLHRHACDANLAWVYEGPDGHEIGIGHTARTPPRWLRRRLRKRDGNRCRFPGCSNTVGLHAHHQDHWAHGGPTDEPNLLLLCPEHHRLVHEGGWWVTGDADIEATFHAPDGRTLTSRPCRLHPRTRKRARQRRLLDP